MYHAQSICKEKVSMPGDGFGQMPIRPLKDIDVHMFGPF